MGLFNQPKPRGFHHEYMFVDTRRDKLRAIEERAKKELGMTEDTSTRYGHIRGTFQNAATHVRRRRERRAAGSFVPGFGMIVILLLLLFAVWRMLV